MGRTGVGGRFGSRRTLGDCGRDAVPESGRAEIRSKFYPHGQGWLHPKSVEAMPQEINEKAGETTKYTP